MKQIIIRLILLMLITKFSIVIADDRLDINNNVQPSISLTSYLGLLEDSSQKLTFADIQQENVKIRRCDQFPFIFCIGQVLDFGFCLDGRSSRYGAIKERHSEDR